MLRRIIYILVERYVVIFYRGKDRWRPIGL